MALAHRPSALKQQNKKHNTLGHRTKGQVLKSNKGRVSAETISRNLKKELGREQRRHKSNQIRCHKREEAIKKKRQLGTSVSPPFLVCVVPLNLNVDPQMVLEYLKNADSTSYKTSDQGLFHLSCSRLKQRFSFVIPPSNDMYAILDTVKVCDTILFVWKVGEEIPHFCDTLLSCLRSQLLPSVVHAVLGVEELSNKKKIRVLKDLQMDINSRFPNHTRPFYMNKVQDVNLLLRQIGAQKQKGIFYTAQRSHMIAEKVAFEGEETGTLKLYGYVRCQPMSVNQLIHISGWGDFQISQMNSAADPFPLRLRDRDPIEETTTYDEDSGFLEVPDPALQQSLDSTCEVDLKDEEQTWPTNEEIEEAYEEHQKQKKKKKKLPTGTSAYQSTWMLSSDEEDDDDDDDDDDETMSAMDFRHTDLLTCDSDGSGDEREKQEYLDDDDDNTTLTSVADDYDQKIDYHQEMDFLDKMKAAKEDASFPDEVDTPFDISAQVRFQKYRGLQSFRTSPWDKNEELPLDYQRIMHFTNFYHTKKRIFKLERQGAIPGWFVVLHLNDVPRHLYEEHKKTGSPPLAAFSLLPHEQKMSVVNLVIKSHPSGHLRPIKSKERLVFQVGVRRFANSPIFSEHANGDKHKFVRFFHPGQTVVATMFAPVSFPPCAVSVFRERADGAQDLVASGSVLSSDANRIICKRTVLSGHPFKVNRKSAVIRYMFFNTDDISYFKTVELRTKWGRRGHIKEALGTHGHMKCVFDMQLKSQDTVLMNLYKRVFPKWKFDPYVARPPPLYPLGKNVLFDTSDRDMDGCQPQAKKKKVQFMGDFIGGK